jgi:hypothetical protein
MAVIRHQIQGLFQSQELRSIGKASGGGEFGRCLAPGTLGSGSQATQRSTQLL